MVVRVFVAYMLGGKLLTFGNRCLWNRANNSSANLFKTLCTLYMFINNNVNASTVDLDPKNKG